MIRTARLSAFRAMDPLKGFPRAALLLFSLVAVGACHPTPPPTLPPDVEAEFTAFATELREGVPERGLPDVDCIVVGIGTQIRHQTDGCSRIRTEARIDVPAPCKVKAGARISGPAAAAGTSVTAIGACGAANVAIAVATVPAGGGVASDFDGPTAKGAPPSCSIPNLFIPAGGAAPAWYITGCAFWDP